MHCQNEDPISSNALNQGKCKNNIHIRQFHNPKVYKSVGPKI